ncbi:hypothetical protein BJX64DRAFT_269167, partial [Aspergillus heterothallicus]
MLAVLPDPTNQNLSHPPLSLKESIRHLVGLVQVIQVGERRIQIEILFIRRRPALCLMVSLTRWNQVCRVHHSPAKLKWEHGHVIEMSPPWSLKYWARCPVIAGDDHLRYCPGRHEDHVLLELRKQRSPELVVDQPQICTALSGRPESPRFEFICGL